MQHLAPISFVVQALEDTHRVVLEQFADGPLCKSEESPFDATPEAYRKVADEVAHHVRCAPTEEAAVAIMESVLKFVMMTYPMRMDRRREELGLEISVRRVRPKRT